VAKSPYASDTLVIIVEDDAQNGPDHVDAHRTVALFAGPFVKRHAVVSKAYDTVSMVRTIEDVLGIDPMGLTDGLAAPMSDVFDVSSGASWSFRAVVPPVLRTTHLPLPPLDTSNGVPPVVPPRHDPAYWERVMKGQNFAREDSLDVERFNHALWEGVMGRGVRYPSELEGAKEIEDD